MSTRLSISRYDLPNIINEKKYRIGAEVGVHHGWYSYYLLKHSNLIVLHSVDSYIGKLAPVMSDAESLLREFGIRSEMHNMTSLDAAAYFAGRVVFDFVYIDADHTYNAVKKDMRAWWSLIRTGGMMAGHDYVVARKCGVIQAVDEFVQQNNVELSLTREPWTTWMIEKP